MKNFNFYLSALAISCLFFSCIKDTVPKGIPGGSAKTGTDTTTKSTTDTATTPIIKIDPAMLTGDWNLVNDSLNTAYWGIWDGRAPVATNYIGKAGDNYNFKSGALYISENAKKDTDWYKINVNHIQLRYAYIDGSTGKLDSTYNDGFTVLKLTDRAMTISFSAISPETILNRVINLKK